MGESSPKLLDLIPKDKEWLINRENEERRNGSCSDHENKLELRLGLPGGGEENNWSTKNTLKNSSPRERNESLLSLNYHLSSSSSSKPSNHHHHHHHHHPWSSQFLQNYQTAPLNSKGLQLPIMTQESSQPCSTRIVDLKKNSEKKAFSEITAVPNSSQKRAAPAPVVGWPPIRSFRKNLASSSSAKPPVPEIQNAIPSKPVNEKPAVENSHKGLFVKINMDGVPIGRKVDLSAYDNYEKLSSVVDELFRGLLAAQRETLADGIDNKQEGPKPITGLLDGSGEYTLVYEDNEGDRMLVGDVPWHMFVSTVKRLRVLKSSDLPTLSRGGSKQEKMVVENASK